MKIVIIGAGRVGNTLAQHLSGGVKRYFSGRPK